MLFFWTFYYSKKKILRFYKSIKHLSIDTEDWSNDAENSAVHHQIKFHFKIYLKRTVILNCIFLTILLFYYILDQINVALVSIRYL